MDLGNLHRAHVGQLLRQVATLLENGGFSALVVHSGTPIKRTDADDQCWPLRPTPHFQHWLPLADPGCLLIVVRARKPVLVRPRGQGFSEAPAPPATDHFWDSFEVMGAAPAFPKGRVG